MDRAWAVNSESVVNRLQGMRPYHLSFVQIAIVVNVLYSKVLYVANVYPLAREATGQIQARVF